MITKCILLYVLGFLAYYCLSVYKEFRGSSGRARNYIGLSGIVGNTVFYILLVWSFWLMPWWVPVVVLVASLLSSGLPFFFDSVFARIVFPAVCLVLSAVLVCLYIWC